MKRWYVVQVYTGFEDIVKTDIEKRSIEESLQDLFGQILVPAGEITSLFADVKSRKEKIFPGYLLIEMDMTGDTYRLVSSTPRVTRFLGGSIPVPLSQKEIERIYAQMSGKLTVSDEKALYSVGSEVHIINGPFTNFVGTIDKIDDDREKLTVMVSIFGRLTPVELGFDQVKK
jgi:transcription termination/antitermination protein NusG